MIDKIILCCIIELKGETVMDKIREAYKSISKVYDKSITEEKFSMKMFQKFTWGFSHKDYSIKLLESISNDFSGKILDVPVGTGILTYEKFGKMNNSKIICMDYSDDMLEIAKTRFKENSIDNAECEQGDVGNMSYEDETFDIVLSMNGLHVFPDKEKAFSEIKRVLKNNGFFIGCLYIKGISKRTDWFVKNMYVKMGTVTPPFYTKDEIVGKLNSDYKELEFWNLKSVLCFKCKK
jgi:ubiquinone/menaquinone biosynthesis C-methylase UbiE